MKIQKNDYTRYPEDYANMINLVDSKLAEISATVKEFDIDIDIDKELDNVLDSIDIKLAKLESVK